MSAIAAAIVFASMFPPYSNLARTLWYGGAAFLLLVLALALAANAFANHNKLRKLRRITEHAARRTPR